MCVNYINSTDPVYVIMMISQNMSKWWNSWSVWKKGKGEEIKIGTAVAQQSRINMKQTNTNVSLVEQ